MKKKEEQEQLRSAEVYLREITDMMKIIILRLAEITEELQKEKVKGKK